MIGTIGRRRVPLSDRLERFVSLLAGAGHKRGLQIFLAVVLAHWAEHLIQAFQLYALALPVPEARGLVGQWYPWLVESESLHYGYALAMLTGLWILREGFAGRARGWWMASFWFQFWHHFEHLLLQIQALSGVYLFDAPVPISIVQLWVRRPELHLVYNTAVFVPMLIAVYRHMFPSDVEAAHHRCSCSIRPHTIPLPTSS